MDPVARGDIPDAVDGSANGRGRPLGRRLETETVPDRDGMRYVDDEIIPLAADDVANEQAFVVRLRARDVVAPVPPAVHTASVAAAKDLHQRLDSFQRRRPTGLAALDGIKPATIGFGDRRDVLGLLLAALDLQTPDAELGDFLKMLVGREVLGGDEIAGVERGTCRVVGQGVVLPTGLRAGTAIGRALGDHPRHEALPRIRDAERAMDKGFQPQRGHRSADATDVFQGVLARQHHTINPESLHDIRATGIVHRHLGAAVNLKLRIDLLDEANDAQILHDRRVDAAIHTLAQIRESLHQLGRLDQHVEGEVHACPTRMSDRTGLLQLIERELRALVAGVVHGRAEIDGIGAIGDGCAHRVERAGGSEEFRDASDGHPEESSRRSKGRRIRAWIRRPLSVPRHQSLARPRKRRTSAMATQPMPTHRAISFSLRMANANAAIPTISNASRTRNIMRRPDALGARARARRHQVHR